MGTGFVNNKIKTERKLEVRIAENQLEIERTLALRYEVFNLELGEGLPQSAATRKDRDEYDFFCDHLIVIDKNQENKIVGTYRILRRSVAKQNLGFYSDNEFDITKIYELDAETAEIGRSCVHPEYRDGSVISMLWAGLGAYMQKYNVRYLFGCGSIHQTDVQSANEVYAYLKDKNALVGKEFDITPLPNFEIPGFDPNYQSDDMKAVHKRVPALIKGYLRAGAQICGTPALDKVFKTIDFFILFDIRDIESKYGKRFLD
ncbi:GNAT family N-acetyltransferase [Leptospira kirschneri]|uniref:Acetyltransferase (GNAT) domain protein n=1 Tax=Leptospira kirschneri str. H1 TaxID=1049966 RepID=A0A0E2B6A3_9LEPT|nr:GNAT family N-acyltransferase [Leptospira kirschneri]EKO16847.1 acetyltransferase (GNAT) domain protein [Leptospira kirschneri str. H1]EKO59299.1 acetyltransferase (GNAT) domain protein [Leptospira kirschneri str. H2]UML80754.1 GNAT family N-acetyltransferase [Leptospira kirschneri]